MDDSLLALLRAARPDVPPSDDALLDQLAADPEDATSAVLATLIEDALRIPPE